MLRRALSICLATAGLLAGAPAKAQDLPPLPAAIKAQGELRVGVRCDQPPYGFQDQKGQFAGIEVEMAKQIAAWAFGSPDKAAMICVTAENRIPQLTGGKVDMLIATLGKTAERARVIDYATPYNWGGSDLLVLKDSPVTKLADVKKAEMVAMLKGTTQAAWFDAKEPDVKTLRLNSISDALQALKQKRADVMAADVATLKVIAEKDPSVRLVGEPFAVSVGGVGVRKNEPEWLAYLNATMARMATEKRYGPWIETWVSQDKWDFYKTLFPPAPFPPEG
ncbi:transporter substrate-binding domain-containing protein [Bosea lathyri]|jgi:polar amino acid transport system substrate-binding protein|uniref:Amino acid ABC transporter substrate-binding protein, PAAT family n=1 Tax=Bosea lathyri TaxID=1036778 RepID=A0A1H5W6T1_9HYPH|nr:transporter substrate-binding domain-containing protein [Bosea lathyri]SEF95120.1 amino acid ABC transporter substrate-binding protein, PAAT family [Bosea lathyri]